jgi:SAM-dependent methyltransferase
VLRPNPQQSQPWYVAAFRADYLTVYAHRDEADARRAVACCVRELRLAPGQRVLDLCCGAGRHLNVLGEQGIAAVGVDLSGDLLAAARTSGVARPLVRADALRLPFASESFDAVVNLFSSFGYFERTEQHQQMLSEAARVMEQGALALFDLMNPATVKSNLKPETREERDGLTITAQRRIAPDPNDPSAERVEKRVHIRFSDGRETGYTESVRLFPQASFDRLLRASNMVPLRRFGDFDSSPFDPERSPRQIVIAKKQ